MCPALTCISNQLRMAGVRADEYDANGIITPEAYLKHAKRWYAAGADIIGGCCGVGPAHMSLVAQYAAEAQELKH